MSATGTRRRRSLRLRRRNAGREQREENVETIDIDNSQEPLCVDLTGVDTDDSFVDLTRAGGVNESSIVIIGAQEGTPRRDRRQRNRRRQRGVGSDSDEDPAVMIISPEKVPKTPNHPLVGASDGMTPDGKEITCPVCMDGVRQIKADGKRLMSTVCGHVFCCDCINGAVKTQRKCPTCRKTLNNKQYHPLFI